MSPLFLSSLTLSNWLKVGIIQEVPRLHRKQNVWYLRMIRSLIISKEVLYDDINLLHLAGLDWTPFCSEVVITQFKFILKREITQKYKI